MKAETLLTLAKLFERRAQKTKCKGCQRRAQSTAQFLKKAASKQEANG